MSVAAPDVRARLLSVLGIEHYVLRGDPGAEPVSVEGKRVAIACGRDVDGATSGRYRALVAQLLGAAGVAADEAVIVAKPSVDLPTICFGTEPGDRVDALLAPPLATLRQSAAAKRSLWKTLRSLKRTLSR